MKPGPEKQFDPEVALKSAILVFLAKGYEGASISELMSEMQIGKKSLYDTFGNKRELFLKAIAAYAEEHLNVLRKALLNEESPLKNLKSLMNSWVERHSKPCSHGCLFGTSMADFDTNDPEVSACLKHKLESIENVYVETLQKAIDLNEISQSICPKATAQMLICLSQGMALVGRIAYDPESLEGAVKSTIRSLEKN